MVGWTAKWLLGLSGCLGRSVVLLSSSSGLTSFLGMRWVVKFVVSFFVLFGYGEGLKIGLVLVSLRFHPRRPW